LRSTTRMNRRGRGGMNLIKSYTKKLKDVVRELEKKAPFRAFSCCPSKRLVCIYPLGHTTEFKGKKKNPKSKCSAEEAIRTVGAGMATETGYCRQKRKSAQEFTLSKDKCSFHRTRGRGGNEKKRHYRGANDSKKMVMSMGEKFKYLGTTENRRM